MSLLSDMTYQHKTKCATCPIITVQEKTKRFISHHHLDDDISRKEFLFRFDALAAFDFGHFAGRHQYFAEHGVQFCRIDLLAQFARDFVFGPRMNADDIPINFVTLS